jgi:hypothetical protein
VAFNILGIVTGFLILALLGVSFFVPWWQLTVGENLIVVNASPVNTTFGVYDTGFRIPLLSALNLISILGLAASGLVMLIYGFLPNRHYSTHLLGFAYRKPLYLILGFIAGLLVSIALAGAFGVAVPFSGATTITLPSNYTFGLTISIVVVSAVQWPFYLAIVVAVMSVITRIYHSRISR